MIIVNKKSVWVILVTVGMAVIFLCFKYSIRDVNVSYHSGQKSVSNPDRGFYVQIRSGEKDEIEEYDDDIRLFLVTLDLYEYRNRAIPEDKLSELEETLKEAKNRNVKCMFRAAYGFEREDKNDADSLERISGHIAQIAPVLNAYKDQITCVQAGFFGPWGEWHSSAYLDTDDAGENRCWLVKELLAQLDDEIVVNVRRPVFLREAVEAGCPIRRLGLHNDGLMSSETDLGTYEDEKDRKKELDWLEKHLVTGINGGEMPYVNEYSQMKHVMNEFPKMNISYLNMQYNEDVYTAWKTEEINGENAFDYVKEHLGYRLYLSSVKYPEKISHDLRVWNKKIEIELNNEGFAPIADNYGLEWVVETADGKRYMIRDGIRLSDLDGGEHASIVLPVWNLRNLDIQRVGIRISRVSDEVKNKETCVELVNDEFHYAGGINYVLENVPSS